MSYDGRARVPSSRAQTTGRMLTICIIFMGAMVELPYIARIHAGAPSRKVKNNPSQSVKKHEKLMKRRWEQAQLRNFLPESEGIQYLIQESLIFKARNRLITILDISSSINKDEDFAARMGPIFSKLCSLLVATDSVQRKPSELLPFIRFEPMVVVTDECSQPVPQLGVMLRGLYGMWCLLTYHLVAHTEHPILGLNRTKALDALCRNRTLPQDLPEAESVPHYIHLYSSSAKEFRTKWNKQTVETEFQDLPLERTETDPDPARDAAAKSQHNLPGPAGTHDAPPPPEIRSRKNERKKRKAMNSATDPNSPRGKVADGTEQQPLDNSGSELPSTAFEETPGTEQKQTNPVSTQGNVRGVSGASENAVHLDENCADDNVPVTPLVRIGDQDQEQKPKQGATLDLEEVNKENAPVSTSAPADPERKKPDNNGTVSPDDNTLVCSLQAPEPADGDRLLGAGGASENAVHVDENCADDNVPVTPLVRIGDQGQEQKPKPGTTPDLEQEGADRATETGRPSRSTTVPTELGILERENTESHDTKVPIRTLPTKEFEDGAHHTVPATMDSGVPKQKNDETTKGQHVAPIRASESGMRRYESVRTPPATSLRMRILIICCIVGALVVCAVVAALAHRRRQNTLTYGSRHVFQSLFDPNQEADLTDVLHIDQQGSCDDGEFFQRVHTRNPTLLGHAGTAPVGTTGKGLEAVDSSSQSYRTMSVCEKSTQSKQLDPVSLPSEKIRELSSSNPDGMRLSITSKMSTQKSSPARSHAEDPFSDLDEHF